LSTTAITELVIAIVAVGVVAVATWAEMSLSAGTRVDIRRLLDNRLSREDALTIERTQRLRSSLLLIEMLASAVAVWMIAVVTEEHGPVVQQLHLQRPFKATERVHHRVDGATRRAG
jgi:alanine dehydrogenase